MASADDFGGSPRLPGCRRQAALDHAPRHDPKAGLPFATVGSPDVGYGMVGLLPEQQEPAIEAEPEAFKPEAGAWGRGGSALVKLDAVSGEWLERTLEWAWRKRAPAKLQSR